jgi:gamma-glutamylcyclotransferase (GGCT)/AIG2-like uncharacterized protein YtfP
MAAIIQQDDFRVWHFFYGTLSDPEVLGRVLDKDQTTFTYKPASVQNAEMTTWGGKYKGLIDGCGKVQGYAYLVETESDENKLRYYETHHYEVVRCEFEVELVGICRGLTFRFIGDI